jgi:hypothetical protein
MVDALQDYLGNAGNKPFECPAAKGIASVRDPANYGPLSRAQRFLALPGTPPWNPTDITTYSEYWFNDSGESPMFGHPDLKSGVSDRKVRLIRHFEDVVVATDALDEFPRHAARKNRGTENVGANNFLFGDQSIRLIDITTYWYARDKWGAEAPFYNWGHTVPEEVSQGRPTGERMGIRETINQKPWIGWVLAGVFLLVGVGYIVWGKSTESVYSADRLQETVTIKFTDDNSTMTMPRGRLMKLLSERPQLVESEGITNPKTGKPTGFLYNEADWKAMVQRINAEKAEAANAAQGAPGAGIKDPPKK